ncbi:hypothetical protein E2562_034249 [Oryza meyeriana var. granulata]|uniref:Uncharacterized protein n=1 Tax=Oryza meyeriana var. granulata TaxID=110450 RepID=A0A6G1CAS9_9ORYZ|nr:hypothetical protein E2562_034249 [Oryza meyeriana var. granulata]
MARRGHAEGVEDNIRGQLGWEAAFAPSSNRSPGPNAQLEQPAKNPQVRVAELPGWLLFG